MGKTVIEKIVEHNTGRSVKPGDIVTVNVDRVMIHDIFIPFVAEKFKEMGFEKRWDPDKVVLIYDHLVPASQLDDTRHFNAGDAFASPDVVARIVEAAESSPDVIYGQTQLVDAGQRVLGNRHLTAPRHLTFRSFARGMVVCHQAFVPRLDVVGHYDLQYRLSADYEWCLRCLKASQRNVYLGDEPMVDYLVDGMSAQHRAHSLRERWQIMCRYYGFVPTLLRHIGFVPRFVANRLKMRLKRGGWGG